MYFGGYQKDYETGKEFLIFFHRKELNEYKGRLSGIGGLTVKKMTKMIDDFKSQGLYYRVTPYAKMKLMARGIILD
jgi:hypothetical protein